MRRENKVNRNCGGGSGEPGESRRAHERHAGCSSMGARQTSGLKRGTAGAAVGEELGAVGRWEGPVFSPTTERTKEQTPHTHTQKSLVCNPSCHESAPILHLLVIERLSSQLSPRGHLGSLLFDTKGAFH